MPFDFSKNETVTDLATVPAEHQSHYTKSTVDGKDVFVVSEGSKALVTAYSGVSTALTKAQADKKASSDESAKRRGVIKSFDSVYDGMGLSDDDRSVDGVMSHVNGLLEQVKGGKEVKINLDKINSENAKRMQELSSSKDAKYDKLNNSLVKHMITEVATSCVAKAGGSVELLLPIISKSCKVVEDGDDHVVRVVDNQGDVRSDGAGGMLSVDGLVKELKASDVYARAFDSDKSSGSGAKPGSGNLPRSAQHNQGKDRSSMNKITDGLKKRQAGG